MLYRQAVRIIAYLIWKGSYNFTFGLSVFINIIAYLIWKGSYNEEFFYMKSLVIIAYLIWKESYNLLVLQITFQHTQPNIFSK